MPKRKTKKTAKSRFRFLWITDPWDTLDHSKDTSLRLAQESLELGYENWWCDVRSIRWENDDVRLDAFRIDSIGADRAAKQIRLGAKTSMSPQEFSSLQYRTDPPVDLAYQHPLQLLHLAAQSPPRGKRLEIVNPVEALLLANEKLEAGVLKGLLPPTVVSSQWEPLKAFGIREKKTVLKPLHTAQSKGVELLNWTDTQSVDHAMAKIKEASANFERPVLLQRYLPGIQKGETRLWFLDGNLLASARKLPLKNDFRVNIDQGSGLAPHSPTAIEKKAAAAIGKRLRNLGVRLAAVDLIEGYVTDFNLTSPGLITQMEKVLGQNLARPIIKALTHHLKMVR